MWEISGHIVLKRRKDYELATEDYAWKLLAEVSLSQDRFEDVKVDCLKAAFGGACNENGSFNMNGNHKNGVVPNHGEGLIVEG